MASGAAAAAAFAFWASAASGQLADLNLNDPGSPACVPTSTVTGTFDSGTALNENILALTNPAGEPVFWEVSFDPNAPSTVSCTASTAGTFVTGYSCDNGLEIALPAGATDLVSVSSAQPVTVTAPVTATEGVALFSLTATRDGGGFETCQMFYQIELLAPKKAFDLVFALDKSGSMSSASGSGTRWDALRTGVTAFLPFIEDAAGAPAPLGSRLGLTFFDSSVATPPTTAMFDILDGSGNPTPQFAGIVGVLAGTGPGGATAMGQGLQDGIAKANNASRPRVVVLFTDGEQNVDPEVALDGCGFENPASDINPPNCPATEGHKIITMGVGSPSGDYLATLANLAANNRGTHFVTDNGAAFNGPTPVPTDIGGVFSDSIGAALEDNSPQLIAKYGGTLQPDPAQPNELDAFVVNRQVDAVALSFALGQRFETPNLAMLAGGITISRDGADVTSQFQPRIYGNFSDVLTLVAPRLVDGTAPRDLDGEYTVTITAPQNSGVKPSTPFRLYAYAEDRRFDATSDVGTNVRKVNDPVEVSVQLDWINLPIEDAQVVVRAFLPGADMGELLSAGDPIDTASVGNDGTPNAGVQKYDQLTATDPGFLAALALSPNAVAMTHQGGGRYTGDFVLPDTVGAVHLVYDVAGENAGLYGRIQRHWYETVYATWDEIDLAASELASKFEGDGLVLNAKFRRPGGKLIGPGQVRGFSFDGATLDSARDLQDGRYEFVLAGAAADTPIKVSLGGETVYEGPAGWGKGPGRSIVQILQNLPWWGWLLLILLLFILLWILMRVLRPSTP
ncbi:VWA domain-containing protein [Marimonas arenosa]|uniref:VWA domain-containing protein n=2 Tax=Marimonas arenosa TaxID=1795305 RepID=A0AAE3WBN7_9RHOB|nr:VWA domain-containing protein [Marimonas arenosa]